MEDITRKTTKPMDRMPRKEPQAMDEVIHDFIRGMRLTAGFNTQRVFDAWDEVSCAGNYTVDRFFKNGILYITLNSSVVRNRLSFQIVSMVHDINEKLLADPLFIKDDPASHLVQKIILK